MGQFLIKEMDREGGNKEKMREWREWNFSIFSFSPFSHLPDARMQQVVQPCHPLFTILFNSVHHESNLVLRKVHQLSVNSGHIHHIRRLIFTFNYTFLFISLHHESNLVFRKNAPIVSGRGDGGSRSWLQERLSDHPDHHCLKRYSVYTIQSIVPSQMWSFLSLSHHRNHHFLPCIIHQKLVAFQ